MHMPDEREQEKREQRWKAEVRMLRRALNAALDRIDELERELVVVDAQRLDARVAAA